MNSLKWEKERNNPGESNNTAYIIDNLRVLFPTRSIYRTKSFMASGNKNKPWMHLLLQLEGSG